MLISSMSWSGFTSPDTSQERINQFFFHTPMSLDQESIPAIIAFWSMFKFCVYLHLPLQGWGFEGGGLPKEIADAVRCLTFRRFSPSSWHKPDFFRCLSFSSLSLCFRGSPGPRTRTRRSWNQSWWLHSPCQWPIPTQLQVSFWGRWGVRESCGKASGEGFFAFKKRYRKRLFLCLRGMLSVRLRHVERSWPSEQQPAEASTRRWQSQRNPKRWRQRQSQSHPTLGSLATSKSEHFLVWADGGSFHLLQPKQIQPIPGPYR